MINDQKKRQIPIRDAKTGEIRYTEPMPTRAPRMLSPDDDVSTMQDDGAVMSASNGIELVQSNPSASLGLSVYTADVETASVSDTSSPVEIKASAIDSTRVKATPSNQAKPKTDIENLEQFIAYAYGRKGQRVKLSSKVERLLAQAPQLDDAATQRLQSSVDTDLSLAVPRQLLLVSREIEGFPKLRESLKSFVRSVMERHPAFSDSGIQAAINNHPDAPSVIGALKSVADYKPSEKSGRNPFKPSEVQALQRNAVYLLATWFACNRGLSLEELTTSFLQVIWEPAAKELSDSNAKLRSITEVADYAAVGLICHRLRIQVNEVHSALEAVQNEATRQQQRLAAVEEELRQRNAELEARTAELEALRNASTLALTEQRMQQESQRMHLQHGLAQLRGRLVRRLEDSAEMLEVGLSALRNRTPRIEVMAERAEHVVDALRAELNSLKDE